MSCIREYKKVAFTAIMVISLIVSSEADAILGPSLCKQMSSFTHDQTIQERIYNQLDGRRHQPVRGHQEEEPTHPSIGKSEVETVSPALALRFLTKQRG
jgi:hypothetical protein